MKKILKNVEQINMKYNFTGQTSPLPFLLWTLHIIRETQQKPWFVQYTKDLFIC